MKCAAVPQRSPGQMQIAPSSICDSNDRDNNLSQQMKTAIQLQIHNRPLPSGGKPPHHPSVQLPDPEQVAGAVAERALLGVFGCLSAARGAVALLDQPVRATAAGPA